MTDGQTNSIKLCQRDYSKVIYILTGKMTKVNEVAVT